MPRSATLFVALVTLLTAGGLPLIAADRVELVAGGGASRDAGPAIQVKLDGPFGVERTPQGDLVFVEMTGHRVGRIDKSGHLDWLLPAAGGKGYSGDGGPAAKAQLNGPHNLAIAPKSGEIYIADTWNSAVRRIAPDSLAMATLAGTGKKGFSGDGGPAAQAELGNVYCVALDPSATQLYIADLDNRRIRAIDLAKGVLRTVAGNGKTGRPTDGARAVESPLVDPRAVAADAAGNVWVLERNGHALRVVDREGRIRTVAGTGVKGNSGDGGPALAATLNGPKHLCVDRDGSILIADTENHVIRRFDPQSGQMTRVAGTGQKGSAGVGGPPLACELAQPHGVYLDANGDLLLSDSSNHRILRIVRGK